jgi:isocitrate dehydrogenase
MADIAYTPPADGNKVVLENGRAIAGDRPIVLFIEGDGVGPDIWAASKRVLDAAVKAAFGGGREIAWMEILAGEKSHKQTGEWLPPQTLDAIREFGVAIKGPLTTPVGGGIRSLNVTLRQELDLYACIRPVRHFKGVPSPVSRPDLLDVVIFRENTEDVYAGIEWASGTDDARKIISFMNAEMGRSISPAAGIGVKPMTPEGSKRLVRRAIQFALEKGKPTVTIMHKGNIMKFTEGAFNKWAYELAADEFADTVVTEEDAAAGAPTQNRVLLKNRIADAMFQQVLLRPDEYHVIATPNLNGDYISDACAAIVGGLGMAPGANIGDAAAIFEATHGTAPKYAGLDKVNPGSVILSGAMLLEFLGWDAAAAQIRDAIEKTIASGTVTYDLARNMQVATEVRCSEFADAIIRNMA